MNREEYIKQRIAEQGHTIKSFAQKIDMPYSTLLSMLKGSIGGAAVDNVIKIRNGLNITINDLQSVAEVSEASFALSQKEKAVVLAYRTRPDMQNAVDTLLDIQRSGNIPTDAASVVAQGEKVFGAINIESE